MWLHNRGVRESMELVMCRFWIVAKRVLAKNKTGHAI
jgi:hypothetical protein